MIYSSSFSSQNQKLPPQGGSSLNTVSRVVLLISISIELPYFITWNMLLPEIIFKVIVIYITPQEYKLQEGREFIGPVYMFTSVFPVITQIFGT